MRWLQSACHHLTLGALMSQSMVVGVEEGVGVGGGGSVKQWIRACDLLCWE